MELHNFVPQILLEDKDYKIFLDVVHRIFNDIHGLISKVPELIDVDNVSDIFLPKLAELVKYNLRYDLDISYQREIIKRLLTIYRARGSNDEIIMAATYGDYDYWVGAHVFYPDAKIDRQKAEMVDPINEELFRHSKSAFSGTDKYPGSTMYREGTIIIKLTYINDKIREAIKKVVPAGIRIYYYLIFDTSNEYGFVIDYGSWVIENETILEIQLNDMKPKPARRSDPTGARSSIYVFDGTKGWVTSFFTSFLLIEPNQADYPVDHMGNKYAGESFDYSEVELEVNQFKNDLIRREFVVDASSSEVDSLIANILVEVTDMILKPAKRNVDGARSSLFTFSGNKVAKDSIDFTDNKYSEIFFDYTGIEVDIIPIRPDLATIEFLIDFSKSGINADTSIISELNNTFLKPAKRSVDGARSSLFTFSGNKLESDKSDSTNNDNLEDYFDYSELEVSIIPIRPESVIGEFSVDASNPNEVITTIDIDVELFNIVLKPAKRSSSDGSRSSLFVFNGTKTKSSLS